MKRKRKPPLTQDRQARPVRKAPAPRRRYSILKKLSLSLGVIVLFLLLCEAGLRFTIWLRSDGAAPFWGRVVSDQRIERPDPVLNHALQEGASFISTGTPPGLEYCVSGSISAQGLNDEEIPEARDPAEKRVLVLGDSFVEARQVPRADNLCSLLEKDLGKAAGGPVRVINAGVSSYSQILQYLYYKKQLARYEPDLVILVFFSNDVFDNLRYAEQAKKGGDGVITAVPPVAEGTPWYAIDRPSLKLNPEQRAKYGNEIRGALAAPLSWPASHSYLAATVATQVRALSLRRRFPDPPTNDEFFILEDDPELASAQAEGWALTGRYIRLLRDECAGNGAKLVITTAPIASQVYGQSSYDRFFFSGKCTQADQQELRKIAADLDCKFVDLLTPLQKAGPGLYYSRDGHWTKKGHQVAASALLPVSREMLGRDK